MQLIQPDRTMLLPLLFMMISSREVLTAGPFWETGGNNVCYLEQADCKYRITMLPVSCNHANDQPWAQRQRSEATSEHGKKFSSEKSHVLTSSHYVTDVNPEAGLTSTAGESLRKLDEMEQKLLTMMNDLSIKSLRHIREIRSEIRHVSKSVDDIRDGGGVYGTGRRFGGGRRSLASFECPPEFVRVGTWPSCYRFSSFEATWNNAKEYCSAFGASLLSLDSIKEAYVIDYLLKSNTAYEESKGWWTSGQYSARNQKWVWLKQPSHGGGSNGSGGDRTKTIDFSRWAAGEPNARSTMHCMILYKPDKYYWHDAACSDKHSFICEIDY